MGSFIGLFLGLLVFNIMLLFVDSGLIYLIIFNASLLITAILRIAYYLHGFYAKYVNDGKTMSERIIEDRKVNP